MGLCVIRDRRTGGTEEGTMITLILTLPDIDDPTAERPTGS